MTVNQMHIQQNDLFLFWTWL